MNLYDYEERQVIIFNHKRYDLTSGQIIANHQHLFKHTNGTFYYRTNEKFSGKVQNPMRISKSFRTSNLNANSLVRITKKSSKEEAFLLHKAKLKPTLKQDFQEFLITFLLTHCAKAQFKKMPLEQEQVPKAKNGCDGSPLGHFRSKLVLSFTFKPEKAQLITDFFAKLDDYAEEYDLTESKDFYFYPPNQPAIPPEEARN